MEPKHTLASRTNHTQPLATVTSMHCVIKYRLDSTYCISHTQRAQSSYTDSLSHSTLCYPLLRMASMAHLTFRLFLFCYFSFDTPKHIFGHTNTWSRCNRRLKSQTYTRNIPGPANDWHSNTYILHKYTRSSHWLTIQYIYFTWFVTSMQCVIKYWLDSTYLIKIAPSFVTCRLHTYATDTRAKSNMEDPFIINSNRNIIMRISKRTHKHT